MFDQNAPQEVSATQLPPTPISTPAPVMPTAPQPVMPVSSQPAPKKGKGLFVALMVLLFVIIVGAAGAAYYVFFMEPSPEKVLGEAFLAMEDVDTLTYDLSVTMEGTGKDPGTIGGEFLDPSIMMGSSMMEDEEDADEAEDVPIVVSITASGAIAAPTEGDKLFSGDLAVAVNANGDKILSVAGATRSVNSATYFQLSELQAPVPAQFQSVFATVLNRWISFDPHDFGDLGDLIDTAKQKAEEEAAQNEGAIREAFATYGLQVLDVTATLEPEAVNGVESRHYAFTVDKDALKGLLSRLDEITGDVEDGKAAEKIDEMFAKMENLTGEVWIGKSDAYLRKVALDWDMVMDEESGANWHGALSLTLDNFNEAVTVEVPEDADPFVTVLMELMGAAQNAAMAEIDRDDDGLSAADEEHYGTSDTNPDTDGDGFKDGAEVEGGYNPNGSGALPQELSTENF